MLEGMREMNKSMSRDERENYIIAPLRRAREIVAKFTYKRRIDGSSAYLATGELADAIRGVLLYVELLEVRVQELERGDGGLFSGEEHWS